ncbi:GDYXXLXY domain-containing protein [Sporomusa sp.]|uniref:GDYXXLXY domain-containing protein n=1 Tax=Sporomusa sp. TaxID=2078658 RepID=UPI002B9C7CB3|nr:GDYXXLXY domain-containing protein [Sporomusa sp.]HWR43017.1 GDYXXLXY domain-containing protein [Sporomusa sp.]
MKSKKLLLSLFIGVALLQAAVPLYMAWRWENVLQTGRQFYWQTAPVDPYDAFKGRYVDLRFKENAGPIIDHDNLIMGQMVYAIIDENAEGKAYISGVSVNRPEKGSYVKVRAYANSQNTAHVILPFTRYYLPEDLAPAAEDAYRKSAGKTGVAAVRIKDGYGVVEQLYIGEKTLYEFLRQSQ